jgi:hypothetical protein
VAFEIGDRAGDLENAEVGARREPHAVGGGHEQVAGGRFDARVAVEPVAGRLRVAGHVRDRGVARVLALACGRDPGAHGFGALAGGTSADGSGRDGADADVHVDPVGERAREPGEVALDVGRRTGAVRVGLAGAPARAGVHRTDQREAGRVGERGDARAMVTWPSSSG